MKTIKLVLVCLLVCLASSIVLADTGTYEITDYKVKLTPKSDGTVEMEYYQKWLVTGGNIPWITIGTANSDYQILREGLKGNIKKISADNSEGSFVKIELDRKYVPNETFEVGFKLIQHKLFYADEKNYGLDFTPGWYDRAKTGHLGIEVFFFAKLDSVSAGPKPTRVSGQSMIWEKSNLGKGEKFSISVHFPKKMFPKEIAKKELKSELSPGAILLIIIVVIVVIALVIWFLASIGAFDDSGYGGGGSIFYGGSRGSGGSGSGRSRSGSGGGGFGGRSVSCACACVSCACACACAGGGAAGCDRKLTYKCPLCKKCTHKNECPISKGADHEIT